MLISRIFEPKKDQLLYHYCSVETLAAIAEYKTIRFSDVNMMNDYNESGYAYYLFEEAADALLKDKVLRKKIPGLDKEYLDRVDEVVSPQQLFLHPTIACFSKSPDVLSQWRGYADDARGVSIGFRADVLNKMPISMLEVEYDREKQIREMKLALAAMYLAEIERGAKWGAEFVDDCRVFAAWSYGFKSDAFREEQEVRLLHVLTVKKLEGAIQLVDVDETETDGTVTPGQKVKFRVANGALVAYVDLPLPRGDLTKLMPELWVGPRNKNGPGNLMYLLGGHGISHTRLNISRATYR